MACLRSQGSGRGGILNLGTWWFHVAVKWALFAPEKILFVHFWHKDDFLSVAGEADGPPLYFGRAGPPDDGQDAGQDCVEDGGHIAPAQLALSTAVHRGGSTGLLGKWGGQADRESQQAHNGGGGWRQQGRKPVSQGL